MISCKNAVFDLLCFIKLTKYGEITADNLANLSHFPRKAGLCCYVRQTFSASF